MATPETTSPRALIESPSDPAAMILVLKQYKDRLISDGNYLEAEKVKHRLKELQREVATNRSQEVISRQSQQRKEVEYSHLVEFQEVNSLWEQEMAKYYRGAHSRIQEIEIKQQEDLDEKKQEIEKSLTTVAKPSTTLLQLRDKKKNAVKLEQFVLAHKITQDIAKLEEQEKEAHMKQRAVKIEHALDEFRKKQVLEMDALKIKLKNKLNEMKRKRAIDIEKVIKRFQNNKKELIRAQGLEKNREEGRYQGRESHNCFSSISRIIRSSQCTTPGITFRSRRFSPDQKTFS
jgi:hypothetical protein